MSNDPKERIAKAIEAVLVELMALEDPTVMTGREEWAAGYLVGYCKGLAKAARIAREIPADDPTAIDPIP